VLLLLWCRSAADVAESGVLLLVLPSLLSCVGCLTSDSQVRPATHKTQCSCGKRLQQNSQAPTVKTAFHCLGTADAV
jgi:hypothetical protein